MEGNVAVKELLGFEERPYDNNSETPNNIVQHFIHNNNILGSSADLPRLRLNNSEMPPQREEKAPTQIGLLRIKLEEAKKENQNLRAMVKQINEQCTALHSRLQLAIKQQHHQLSTSPQSNHELLGNRQDEGEKGLFTRQLLNIGVPSSSDDGSTKEGFASAENLKKIGINLACMHNNVEGEIKNQITSKEAKCKEDQTTTQVPCGKARVSIRARSDFSLMGDGCQWRKYGQKTAKGNPCPRAYYRCSMGTSCPVRKQVQRCCRDNTVLVTTYEGKHNHPLPLSAIPLASTTSSALNTFLSGSITSSSNINNTTTLSNNSLLFPSSTSSTPNCFPCSTYATFSPSASCPTLTLDLTHPTNSNNNNCLQFQRANNSLTLFPLPLHGGDSTTQTPQEKSLALVDVVSEAIVKDPSLKAALFAAISSLNGDDQQTPVIAPQWPPC